MTYLTHDEENDYQRLTRKLQLEGQLSEDEWKYLELLKRKRRGDFVSGGGGMERSASVGGDDPKPSRGSEGNTPSSGQQPPPAATPARTPEPTPSRKPFRRRDGGYER